MVFPCAKIVNFKVVDNNWGVHGLVTKVLFKKRTQGRKLLSYLEEADLIDQMKLREKLSERREKNPLYKMMKRLGKK